MSLTHPFDRAGLFFILLPKCKPNRIRSLLEIFCDYPVPRNKNSALHVTLKVLHGPALLTSSASFQHTLPLISEPHLAGLLQL